MVSTRALFLLAASCAAVALANPYGYGNDYYHPGFAYRQGNEYGSDAEKYGFYDKAGLGFKEGWKSGDYGHDNGDYDHGAHAYGKHAWDDGKDSYSAAVTGGHQNQHGEHADRDAKDAEGQKKYSYFSEGSGPDGYYKKGYFGSEGYDHEVASAHEVKDANGDGFLKGHHAGEKASGGKQGEFEKAGGAKGYYGKGHEQHESGYKAADYGHNKGGQGYHSGDEGSDYKTSYGHN
ncbi:hypothetical protein L596_010722 [Steinernema carpocapsae]|uniref:Uncharacterized protein n=1 Tax=Steinernema carpocapsae TaxID=34508 RepID=A0A4U5PL07_STECR|nr:hypothetical protein L596_010722 [Steinernema carpocapsae]